MYCINCGVKLGNAEKICPLCNTKVYHPEFKINQEERLYPENRMPEIKHRSAVLNGVIIILFLIPVIVTFLADFHFDRKIEWFGYVFGALMLGYLMFALPLWFEKPNPVIFTPCAFAGSGVYLWYINFVTSGDWFLTFALPVVIGLGIISVTVITLLYYLKKGALYIWSGAFMVFGLFDVMVEYFIAYTFGIAFIGWSFFPMVVFALTGGLLLYLAINKSAREIMERKLFF